MVFVTESGKEIQVPSDYTYMSLEKFANEIYRQGRVDERAKVLEEVERKLYSWGISNEPIVKRVLEQLKEQTLQ